MVRELTESAWSVLDLLHQRETSGEMDRQTAQAEAITLIRGLRYGVDRKNYFWINDMHPRMVMHPYLPNLDGKDLTHFADPRHKRLFVKAVEIVRRHGAGHLDTSGNGRMTPAKSAGNSPLSKGLNPGAGLSARGCMSAICMRKFRRQEKSLRYRCKHYAHCLSAPLSHHTPSRLDRP